MELLLDCNNFTKAKIIECLDILSVPTSGLTIKGLRMELKKSIEYALKFLNYISMTCGSVDKNDIITYYNTCNDDVIYSASKKFNIYCQY